MRRFGRPRDQKERRATLNWSELLRRQAAGVIACGFFTVDTVWQWGLYVLRSSAHQSAHRARKHTEHRVGSLRGECLDWLLILGRNTWNECFAPAPYNDHRPHRACAALASQHEKRIRAPSPTPPPKSSL